MYYHRRPIAVCGYPSFGESPQNTEITADFADKSLSRAEGERRWASVINSGERGKRAAKKR